jgi:ABC-type transport system involved in cytochrome c biogenesis permease component
VIWSTATKDLRRLRRDPAALVMWVGLPLAIGSLMTMASGGRSGPEPQAHVLVADRDDSFLSRLLIGALSQDAAGGFIRAETVTEEEGRRRLDKGEADALLVIPEGFDAAILEEKPAVLELVKNPARTILPGIVEESLSILTDGSFYLHRLLGDDLRALVGGPDSGSTFPDVVIADFSVQVNRTVDRLASTLFPPVIELEVISGDEAAATDDEAAAGGAGAESAGRPKPETSVAMFFLPGLLFMSLMFMAQGLAQDLWHERNRHTLRRAVVAPHDIAAFLGGKILYGAVLMTGVVGLTLTVAWTYFGLRWTALPLAVAWTVFAGVVLNLLMTVIMLHASSERTAGVLTMVIVFPLLMVGGSFFPFEVMPAGMAAIGKLTPNGWALEQLKAVILDEVVPGRLAAAFGGLLAVGAALLAWSAARLRSGFARG